MPDHKRNFLLAKFFLLLLSITSKAQSPFPELKWNFNESGSTYVKATFVNQTWVRFNQNNPGTTIFGDPQQNTFDIGLRRTRMQLFGQLSERVFFYTQFGQNNFNNISARKTGTFFHDVYSEYILAKDIISVGTGLAGWSGLSRASSPSVATIMTLDAPIFAQATNDVTDQFLRKLSIFAKGKISKLDYRVAISKPLSIQTSPFFDTSLAHSSFSSKAPENQYQGYFMYQFFDKETNTTPYTTGTYLGKKKVFNIGAGAILQPNAMWHRNENADTVNTRMLLLSVDVFADLPLNKEKGTALSIYAGWFSYDFGPRYIRNLGVMNTANGISPGKGSFNGPGSAFPMVGTGDVLYANAGYLLKKNLFGNSGTLMPYAAVTIASYDRLKDPMNLYETGVNWLINGHNSKMTLGYQSRPVFTANGTGELVNTSRKGMLVLQYQVFL